MSAGDSRLTTGRAPQPSTQFFRLSQLRKVRTCEQVAAVCYRIGSGGIKFLLVRTRRGRWTFPKGGVEPGLTHAQAAALEAFEEAGVHGRIEEASFTRYIRRKGGGTRRSDGRSAKGSEGEIAVGAHLCEVLRLSTPQESKRHPTWFSAEKAKQRLREGRTPGNGTELARVVDRALTRIQRMSGAIETARAARQETGPQKDAAKGAIRSRPSSSATSSKCRGCVRPLCSSSAWRRRPSCSHRTRRECLPLQGFTS